MTSSAGTAENIFHILADLPDFLRRPVLRNRLQEFYVFDESVKRETLSTALNAASSIEAKKLNVLIKSWMEVLSEFDTGRILIMLRLYCEEVLKDHLALKKLNVDSLVQAFMTLDEVKKAKFICCLKEALFCVPNRHKIIQMLPITARNVLEINC